MIYPEKIKSLLCLVLLLSVTAGIGQTVSEQRLARGTQAGVALLEAQPDATEAAVRAQVRRVLVSAYPELGRAPKGAAITEVDSLRNYEQKFAAILEERHPLLNDAALSALAAKRYPLYQVGDHVTVYHARGNQVVRASGRVVRILDDQVLIGSQRIFLSNMALVKDNEREVLKFRPAETQVRRRQYVEQQREQILTEREEFRRTQHAAVEQELLARDRKRNEANGYTYYDRRWLTPNELFDAVAGQARQAVAERRYEALNVKMKHRRIPLDNQLSTLSRRYLCQLPGQLENPALIRLRELEERREREIRERVENRRLAAERARKEAAEREAAEKEQQRLAAERKRQEEARLAAERKRQEEEEKQRLAEEEAERERQAAEEKRLAAEAEKKRRQEAEARAQAEEEARLAAARGRLVFGVIPLPIAIGGVLVLVAIIGVVAYMIHKRRQETDPFAKFFEGKGKLQKDFWSQASADPEHFKYVAYMFPSMEEATKALGHLTYLKPGPGGNLRCTRDLQFGVYPHLDGAVAFVGGVKFTYALWREASAVLPELPHAQYFKVSTEPEVQMILPNISQMKMNVESLGIEEVQNENGEFIRLYKYFSSSREEAEKFLNQFDINEVGIVVQIQTADGILGKDENGMFTLEN